MIPVAAVFPPLSARGAIDPGSGCGVALITAAIVGAATSIATDAAGCTTTAARSGFGFVDAEGTAHQLSALQGFDRAIFAVRVGEFDKGESALATGVPL